MRAFKIALIQMRVVGGDPNTNIATAIGQIGDAAAAGAEVMLLPECMNLGWTDPSAKTLAEPVPGGPTCTALSQAAVQYGVYICSGIVEKTDHGTFNSAILIDPSGKVILDHHKINELSIGYEFYDQGRGLAVVETPLCNIGIMTCADGYADYNALGRALGQMGAEVILSPCAWAVEPGYDNTGDKYAKFWLSHYEPVATEYQTWIAAVSNVGPMTAGPWAGHICIGNSLVVNASGEKVAEGAFGVNAQEIIYANVDPVDRPRG